jgi:hypothetical protein
LETRFSSGGGGGAPAGGMDTPAGKGFGSALSFAAPKDAAAP